MKLYEKGNVTMNERVLKKCNRVCEGSIEMYLYVRGFKENVFMYEMVSEKCF